jgi:hypothetical protein
LALSNIAKIDLFDDVGDGKGPQQIDTQANPAATFLFTTGVLSVGTHKFDVLVTDTAGHVSAISNIAVLDVPATLAAPSPVTDLTATLVPDAAATANPVPASGSAPSTSG